MKPARREAAALVVRALLWLPVCLVAWYFAAGAFAWFPVKVASAAIDAVAGKVEKVEIAQRFVAYSLAVQGPYRPGEMARAEARVEVPAATYTFGIAIFVALVLAAGGWRAPARLALGVAILIPLPAFGIAFDALRQLGAERQLAALLAWGRGTREAIALGYQVGSLLLPTLAPIIAWLALFPGAWRRPARNFQPLHRLR